MKTSLVIPLLFLGVDSNAPIVMAQSAGTFTPIGNMTSARRGHTATLLTNGSVLIAGGCFPTVDGVECRFHDLRHCLLADG